MTIPTPLWILAPSFASAAVVWVATLRMYSAPLDAQTWAENPWIVFSLALSVAGFVLGILLILAAS